ncbi:MAG: Re/Si-specific NAD(P)(+) transhydrogenase subunit alpha [Rhodothermales bacterium]|nr:Re/Si-specific NAD(P)(+) transhydrogenase subunit alpha [Rhodothermales bacterium]
MAISVGIPKESVAGERRVSAVPELVQRFNRAGMDILLEKGAGDAACYADADFEEKGARIVSRAEALGADIVLKVQPPTPEEISGLKKGAVLIGFLSPLDHPKVAKALAAAGTSAFAMELVPRISRAQTMDALSAMGSIGGYRAVLLAAERLPKFFPLLTTAAGTVKPANVLVLGAGVAGLQAIATARRLGARVSAYDIRAEVKEQIESLGGRFVELEIETQDSDDTGGYAKALAEEKAKRQTELLEPHIAKADVVVTTALIPGRPAPVLITENAVKGMHAGSVIVDLAAANGGNCALTKAGETVVANGVTILGPTNLPAEMAVHGSEMYGRTLLALAGEMVKDGELSLDFEDEIIGGSCVCHAGDVVNERVKSLLAG